MPIVDLIPRALRDWHERRSAVRELRVMQALDIAVLPLDESNPLNRARVLVEVGDQDTALEFWTKAKSLYPEYVLKSPDTLVVLLGLKLFDEAESLMIEGQKKNPGNSYFAEGYAKVAEARSDWPEAIRRWALVRKQAPGRPSGYVAGIACLRLAGRLDEAEALLRRARGVLGDNFLCLLEAARLQEAQGKWAEALQSWERVAEQHPSGVVGAARMLFELGRHKEAADRILKGRVRYPTEPDLINSLAKMCERLGDNDTAAEWWSEARRRFPLVATGYVDGIRLLRRMSRLSEARAVLTSAVDRFPKVDWPWYESASLAEEQGDWREAARSWGALRAAHPDRADLYPREALALERCGNVEEAAKIRAEHRRLLGQPAPEEVRETMQPDNLADDVRGIDYGSDPRSIETDTPIGDREASIALDLRLPEEPAPPAEAGPQQASEETPIKQVLADFVSLGGGGPQENGWAFGCEFGFLQRDAGIEPLDLLRWSSIGPDNLIRGLNARFERMGDPETIQLQVHTTKEWSALDLVYGASTDHTQLDSLTIPEEEARSLVCQRTRYLRDKLIKDLQSGEKIFVYRVFGCNILDNQVERLAAAIRAYGHSTLLCVRTADSDHPAFTIQQFAPGILVAYIDRFAPEIGAIHSNPDGWSRICRLAHHYWKTGEEPPRATPLADQSGASPEGLAAMAKAAGHASNWTEALRLWNNMCERFPLVWQGYQGAAAALRELDRLEEAEAVLLAALERFPGQTGPLHDLAGLAERRRQWNHAEHWWRRFIELNSAMWWSYSALAAALREQGRLAEAEATLKDAFLQFPNEPAIFCDHARLVEAAGDWQVTLARWQEITHRFPSYGRGYVGVARALDNLGQTAAAEAALIEAGKHCKDDPTPLLELARRAEQRRDWESALQQYQELERIFPDNSRGFLGELTCLRELGRFEQAEAKFAEDELRFPAEPAFLLERMRLALHRRDWADALTWSEHLRTRFPGVSWGYNGAADALRELGRLEEADGILIEAQAKFPKEAGFVLAAAGIALRRREFDEALRRYELAIQKFPNEWSAYAGKAEVLREQARLDEAEAVLRDAADRFPKEAGPRHDLARLAERMGDWEKAERWWREFLERASNVWWAHAAVAAALHHQGQEEAADRQLRQATARFPNEPGLLAELAQRAYQRHDWKGAEEAYSALCQKFPSHERGYVIGAHALQAQFRLQEARALLEEGLIKTDYSFDLLFELGAFHARGDIAKLPVAIEYMRQARERHPNEVRGFSTGIRYLTSAHLVSEATALAAEAAHRWPNDVGLAREYATLNGDEAGLDGRIAWFITVRNAHPELPAGYVGLATALELAGRTSEADDVLQDARRRFPDRIDIAMAAISAVERRGAWKEAVHRWNELVERFPRERQVQDRLYLAQLRMAEVEPNVTEQGPLPVQSTADGVLSPRELAMQFESLGGIHAGCEFGLFQREYGAEPLGLLRWTTLAPTQLTAALNDRFDGVGLPENTILIPESPPVRQEYFTQDRRYDMRMHTFVSTDEIDRDRFYKQICRRLQYLRTKLIDDLSVGEKIFVYKTTQEILGLDEIGAIRAAMRQYGHNTLLYVRYTDEAHATESVELVEPGLLIGYIERFSADRTGNFGPPVHRAWLSICREAHRLWRAAQ
ncbi:MAG TPA: tetratricopeptide repeat protein [Acetobacteraceae bacterium]|nr:tetratricopeptide repeat protein [Acetobacteraceae bacterium]